MVKRRPPLGQFGGARRQCGADLGLLDRTRETECPIDRSPHHLAPGGTAEGGYGVKGRLLSPGGVDVARA
ncbi:MAG: hypothetical protein ACRD1K_12075 [Acidimicrobiales bacterium]